MFTTLLSVALGGALGASARYLTNVGVMRLIGPGFPLGTVVANVLGSFFMGVLVVVLARKGHNDLAPFLMTGLLGGFTTFSAFSLDTLTLFERGETGLAGLYVGLSVTLSLGAIAVGVLLTRAVIAP
ncbi:fluoride efflux transporter CrcB [Sinisalibacter aestuarii]|uniref:Fluoride-specific ion channel FluC n=1 Tax=Sinisalibacter aestuarii TaxID=2949426 RepID=A0ABQ5LX47_9RHOB|nr:fluoride efflux transporter CrcB [Sinisalibacter aestuarii]GKY89193.1 putative fluoride ion transporter CrcB [Sinisalibacter aestuarii]